MRNGFFAALAACVLLAVTVPVMGHHAVQAQFDFEKPVSLTGVLKKVDWINPHAYFTFDIKDDKTGKVHTWSFETVGPGALRKAGLSRAGFFKVGDSYTVNGFAAKDGTDSAFIKSFVLPDGKTVQIWFGDPTAR